jgi:uncharacterized RDD family membrane protein YckC
MRFRTLKKQSKKQKQFKEELANRVDYASYPDKVKAFIVDLFMIYAPILYFITYVVVGGKDAFQSSQLAHISGVLAYGLIYSILISKFGQTPGKKAYEIKVVDVDTHKNISFFRAFVRFVSFLFSATILLGILLPFYRKDKRSLHDLMSSTVEIKNRV